VAKRLHGGAVKIEQETIVRVRRLSFNSEVFVNVGDEVRPDTVVAKTMLPLPRLFFLTAFRVLPQGNPEGYEAEWLRGRGDVVDQLEVIARFSPENYDGEYDLRFLGVDDVPFANEIEFKSPFPGVIEDVRSETGSVLLRELIDYGQRKAIVNVGQAIGVYGRKLKKYLRKDVGEFVERGTLLAMRVGREVDANAAIAGRVRSPIAGVIKDVDFDKGRVRIERKIQEIELCAGFFGKVTAIDLEGIEITAEARRVFGICGVGGESFGMLRVAVGQGRETLFEDNIREDDSGRVIVGGAFVTPEALEKAAEVGVSGIITGGADHLDLSGFVGKDFAASITGKEKTPFPVIITGRFGKEPMDDDRFEFLKSHDGSWAFIDATTHVRAGVVRPEIIIMTR